MLPTQERQSLLLCVLIGHMQQCVWLKYDFIFSRFKLVPQCFCCNNRIVHVVALVLHPQQRIVGTLSK